MSETLEEIFERFCSFGSHNNLVSADRLTNQKFAKLCKDCGILGEGTNQTITSTDCDIVFNKVKSKTERTIDFAQFVDALHVLAGKKYGKEADAYDHLCEDMFISGGGPKLAKGSTHVQNDEIVQKLTDTSLYTGTHKNRFDETGKGLGREGRVDNSTGIIQFNQITNRAEADVRGVVKVTKGLGLKGAGSKENLGSKGNLVGSKNNLNGSKNNLGSKPQLNQAEAAPAQ